MYFHCVFADYSQMAIAHFIETSSKNSGSSLFLKIIFAIVFSLHANRVIRLFLQALGKQESSRERATTEHMLFGDITTSEIYCFPHQSNQLLASALFYRKFLLGYILVLILCVLSVCQISFYYYNYAKAKPGEQKRERELTCCLGWPSLSLGKEMCGQTIERTKAEIRCHRPLRSQAKADLQFGLVFIAFCVLSRVASTK